MFPAALNFPLMDQTWQNRSLQRPVSRFTHTCNRDCHTLGCEFEELWPSFLPAWRTEQWELDGGKPGLSLTASSAGWNLKPFKAGDESVGMMMVGDMGGRSSNCYEEEMEGWSHQTSAAAATVVTLTISLMRLGVTSQINEMSSPHNVRMMDGGPGSQLQRRDDGYWLNNGWDNWKLAQIATVMFNKLWKRWGSLHWDAHVWSLLSSCAMYVEIKQARSSCRLR